MKRQLALLLGVCVLGGCQATQDATVNGAVTLDSQPVAQGDVRFVPIDGKSKTAGALIEDGKFTAQVPLGDMRVEIYSPRPTGKKEKLYDTPDSPEKDTVAESIPERYNTRSELKINVKPGTQSERFDLKSK